MRRLNSGAGLDHVARAGEHGACRKAGPRRHNLRGATLLARPAVAGPGAGAPHRTNRARRSRAVRYAGRTL